MKIKLSQPQFILELGQRSNQEDSIYPSASTATPNDRLFIVCDGMGGHDNGEVASNTVCETLAKYVKENVDEDTVFTEEMFREALSEAYTALDKADNDRSSKRKMGTTLTFVLFHKGGCFMAHIGDSRIYHVRPSSQQILYISRDHSLVFDLFRSGEISYEQMKTHPRKNVITRALMPGEENRVNADCVNTTDIQPGDYFYLCSDGMTEQMDDTDIAGILSSSNSDESKQQRLVSATQENRDNHSAYIIRVEEVETTADDSATLTSNESTSRSNVLNYIPELKEEKVTKVESGDFVADDPSLQKPRKKFPWIKIVLALIVIFTFTLFIYIPKLREQKISDWENTQEERTITDSTLENYNNADEKTYGEVRRDSLEAAKKKAAENAAKKGDEKESKPASQPTQTVKKPTESKPAAQPSATPAQPAAAPQAVPQSAPATQTQSAPAAAPAKTDKPAETAKPTETAKPAETKKPDSPPANTDNEFFQ